MTTLPATVPLQGRIMDDPVTPGSHGRAVINGVQFAVTAIELRLGRIIFECRLTAPARFPFTVYPGTPAKIYGVDDHVVADFLVPGVNGSPEMICEVHPGETVTIFLPLGIKEVDGMAQADPHRFDNMGAVNASW